MKRSRYGKTSDEKAIDGRMERTVVHASGLSLAQAHHVAKTMSGSLLRTERRGGQIVSIFRA
jgi:hypothetical protein